ncbi:DMT family transporter [Ruegeria sp. Alg231-54]|uniref:DMT family transporter n=1 Tax=Ruegeria sp. Alg231-54 TaxID=1922221 RepID=UPI001F46064A|nr:DMT family transporter [Ruegeria sp. Alg231-54]
MKRANLWENRAKLCANTAQNYEREHAKFLNKINASNAALCAHLQRLLAAGLIVVAAVIAGSPASVAAEHLPTLLLSLAAPFWFGFGICVLVYRLSRIAPLARIASVSLGAVLGLAPLILGAEVGELLPREQSDWLFIVGIGLVTAFVPQLIYTICSPVIGASQTAVVGSIELPTMFAVGYLAFGEAISFPQALACALVLGAIAITRSRKTRTVSTVLAKSPRR